MKLTLSAAVLLAALLPVAAHADRPASPGSLHALTDLRAARRNLEHRPGDAAVSIKEEAAITEIDRAIGETLKAVRENEKNPRDHRREDADLDRPGRLQRALELLKKAQGDLAEEAPPEAEEHKQRTLLHIDRAIDAAKHAVRDLEPNR